MMHFQMMRSMRATAFAAAALLVSACSTLPAGDRPADMLGHDVSIPRVFRGGDGWPGFDGAAKRYLYSYENGWWSCVETFAKDIDHVTSLGDRAGNGWPCEVCGYEDGYRAAETRVAAIKARYGSVKARAILTASLESPEDVGASKERQKFAYDRADVRLEGTLWRSVYPGPPNYEDVKSGDRPEIVYLVRLAEAVDVTAPESDPRTTETNVDEVQLVLKPDDWKACSLHVGSVVTAVGSLFHADTGHHHTMVLLKVTRLQWPIAE